MFGGNRAEGLAPSDGGRPGNWWLPRPRIALGWRKNATQGRDPRRASDSLPGLLPSIGTSPMARPKLAPFFPARPRPPLWHHEWSRRRTRSRTRGVSVFQARTVSRMLGSSSPGGKEESRPKQIGDTDPTPPTAGRPACLPKLLRPRRFTTWRRQAFASVWRSRTRGHQGRRPDITVAWDH